MKMKFDKDKCLKLLKERKSLQKEGKLLWDYDKAKNDELIRYLSLIEDQIFWESRKEYIQILDLFVTKKITLNHFFKLYSPIITCSDKQICKKIFFIPISIFWPIWFNFGIYRFTIWLMDRFVLIMIRIIGFWILNTFRFKT